METYKLYCGFCGIVGGYLAGNCVGFYALKKALRELTCFSPNLKALYERMDVIEDLMINPPHLKYWPGMPWGTTPPKMLARESLRMAQFIFLKAVAEDDVIFGSLLENLLIV